MDIKWACTLTQPIPVYNVNGTPNEGGAIHKIADVILWYNGHAERTQFVITQLGKQSMILGFTWLHEHNPEINWQTKEVCMLHAATHAGWMQSTSEGNSALRLHRSMLADLVVFWCS